MMDPLQIKTDEALELPNTINSSNDLDLNLSNSCSSPQLLVGSFTLKEEGMLSKEKVQKPLFDYFTHLSFLYKLKCKHRF